jgi:hypothetical protein
MQTRIRILETQIKNHFYHEGHEEREVVYKQKNIFYHEGHEELEENQMGRRSTQIPAD